jgi:hypothetical protein
LIAAGYSPGPLFHDILERLHEAQLEGELRTREEALEWLRKNYGDKN